MNIEEKTYLLATHKALNLTPTRFKRLKSAFTGWEAVWKANKSSLTKAGIEAKAVDKFLSERDKIDPEALWKYFEEKDISILIYGEKDYPAPLRDIHSPPIVLFCRGKILPQDFPAISVVGPRKISSYGRKALTHVVAPLAQQGITIVSGLAIGADYLAHQAAYDNGARTICVLGNGIDYVYPTAHTAFAKRIVDEDRGAILSEYFPKVEPRAEHFPMRNRIVAGLSRATIVAEAALNSGSLITAQMALDMGKDVFAIPGEIFSQNSRGTNELLQKSEAIPALSAEQILAHLNIQNVSLNQHVKSKIEATPTEQAILDLFGSEPRYHVNDLVKAATKEDMTAAVVFSTLSILELKGLVQNLGNQTYSRTI